MKLFGASLAVVCIAVPVWGETYLVLPFFNASRTSNIEWIGESVSESIREALSSQGLVTLNRDDRLEAYRRLGLRFEATLTRATLIKIGQALDADEVIYGDFEFQPAAANVPNNKGSLKITAHVLALRAMKQGPEFSELGSLEDLAAEQTRLAWQTLRYLNPKAGLSEADFLRQRPQVRVDAMESYIRGLLAASPDQKNKLFTQAARLDPSFSQAHFQLGMLAYTRNDCKTAADSLQKVALSDVGYRQAMFYLGICRYQTGNFAGAQAAFEVVVKTVPLNEVFNNLGAAQSRLDRPEALDTFAKALEGDSSDPLYHFNVGYALWRQGKFEAAAERFRAVLDRDKQDSEATLMLGKCLKRVGPQSSDSSERMERLKTTYEESAYWQLKAVLQPEKP
jgi:tetratricopeptide (TPR) repeat protein